MKPIYRKIYEQAKPYLQTRKNLIHTQNAFRYALKLLKQEKSDEEVVIPAVLLHDVGWKVIPENLHLTAFGPNPSNPKLARVHEIEGAKIAKKILEKLHYPSEKLDEICRIIRGHDSRKRSISKNDRIVKDADKLTRYHRKGMAIDSDRFQVPREIHIRFLEAQIEKWFFLPTSRQWAREEITQRRIEIRNNIR